MGARKRPRCTYSLSRIISVQIQRLKARVHRCGRRDDGISIPLHLPGNRNGGFGEVGWRRVAKRFSCDATVRSHFENLVRCGGRLRTLPTLSRLGSFKLVPELVKILSLRAVGKPLHDGTQSGVGLKISSERRDLWPFFDGKRQPLFLRRDNPTD